jgi:hypothetical protein
MNVLDLINTNKWSKIYNLVKDNKIDLDKPIHKNDDTIVHHATINKNKQILDYVFNESPESFKRMNQDGNNCYHLMALYNDTNMLKKYLTDINDIYLINNHGDTIYHILFDNFEFISWLIQTYDNIDLNVCNNDNMTILLKNIIATNQNDKLIKLLLDHTNINFPETSPPLNVAISHKKTSVIDNLLKHDKIDVNTIDNEHGTPFLYATFAACDSTQQENLSLLNKLIDMKANINYTGRNGELNPLIHAIKTHKNEVADILITNNFNVNLFDKSMCLPLHYITENVSPAIIAKLIYYSDLNKQNIDGNTPLHILSKNNMWENYNVILETKQLDTFIKNRKQVSPINSIMEGNINNYLDMVTKSYINNMNNKKLKKIYGNESSCIDNFDQARCSQILKNHILTNMNSIPTPSDSHIIINQLDHNMNNNVSYGKFNADILHGMIYIVCILEKYTNIGIPYQINISDKAINDKMNNINLNLYKYDDESIINELVKIYTDYFYEITPYLILWKNKHVYYINKHLSYYLKRCFNSDHIRFIILKLTLIINESSTHANIIIFDKKNGTLERFEPYGNVYNTIDLDAFIMKNIGTICEEYHGQPIKYYNPAIITGNNIGFQSISNDSDVTVKKLGDPFGYCLAWTLWYLEMRITNPDVMPTDLIQKCFQDIVNTHQTGQQSSRIFIDYIRNYSMSLDKLKNEFLEDSKISRNNFYNIILTDKEKNLISKNLARRFSMITSQYD